MNDVMMIRKAITDDAAPADGAILRMREDTRDSTSDGIRRRWLKVATEDVDRVGDRLLLAGMDQQAFALNPQFLWMHGHRNESLAAIGRIVALEVHGNALYALAEYAPSLISPLAERIYQMECAGMLPANSVGFRAIRTQENRYGGIDFLEWELLECSKVELPMNPFAVDDGSPPPPAAMNIIAPWLAA